MTASYLAVVLLRVAAATSLPKYRYLDATEHHGNGQHAVCLYGTVR
jgi:hypothetical protein